MGKTWAEMTPAEREAYVDAEGGAEAYATATAKCNACPGPASCSEFGRCVLEAEERAGTHETAATAAGKD